MTATLFQFDIRPVPSLQNKFVSASGDVYTRDRNNPRRLNPRKLYRGKVGYYTVMSKDWVDHRDKPRYVHRMVAEAFLPKPEINQEVRHLDGNKLNNCRENLAWGTHRLN